MKKLITVSAWMATRNADAMLIEWQKRARGEKP